MKPDSTVQPNVHRAPYTAAALVAGALLTLGSAFAGPWNSEAVARSKPGGAAPPNPIWTPVAPGGDLDPQPGSITAPRHYSVRLQVKLKPEDRIAALLARAGATQQDAAQAGALIGSATSLPAAGDAEVMIFLGDKVRGGARKLEQVALRPALDRRLAVTREAGALTLSEETIEIDATPLRISGKVGDGLFWSLRAAGAAPEIAETYLAALAARLGPRPEFDPGDRFDLIVERRRTGIGDSELGSVQFVGLDRVKGADLKLVRWPTGAGAEWVSPDQSVRSPTRLMLPIAGMVTSRFGNRVHPIFRTIRFHKGVDLRATWGTPVHAANDGTVTAASWSGGHGLRVRLAHRGGLSTSYSHLSRTAALAGRSVRRGDLIGYVGSTGFSTGAHLHFEVARNGRPLDPLGAGFGSTKMVNDADRSAVRARLAQLLAVPVD